MIGLRKGLLFLSTLPFALGCASVGTARPWQGATIGSIDVVSQLSEDETHRHVEETLRFQAIVTRLTTAGDGALPTPTVMYLFANSASISPFRNNPAHAGFFAATPSAGLLVVDASTDDALAVMRHEYIHALLHSRSNAIYPAWYEEGYAEFMSTAEFVHGEVRLGQVPRGRADWIVHGYWIPLKSVLHWNSRRALPDDMLAMMYAESWAFVHFLEFSGLMGYRDRRAAMRRYLEAIDAGSSVEAAFRSCFGETPEAVEKELRDYLHLPMSPYIAHPDEEFEVAHSSEPLRVLGQVEVDTRMSELALAGGPTRLELALSLARRAVDAAPDDARAHLVLARAMDAAGLPGAEAHYVRAEELAPDDVNATLYHVAHLLAQDAERTPQRIDAIVRRLEAATLRQPDNAFALRLAAEEALREKNLDLAIAALERAWDLDHRDVGVALELARLYRDAGRDAAACSLTRRISHRPHLAARARDVEAALARCTSVAADARITPCVLPM